MTPVPLDPVSWAAVERALSHRQDLRTSNPHLVVTRGTKAGRQPASSAYLTHLLDPAGVCPRTVRCTRLAALINSTDPKLVADALGMNTQGAMFYLADHVDAVEPQPCSRCRSKINVQSANRGRPARCSPFCIARSRVASTSCFTRPS